MTPTQIKLIRRSFERITSMKSEFASAFYTRLFKIAPEVTPLFTGDMTEQGNKLTTLLGTVINNLENLENIIPTAQQLSIKHIGYGVTEKHYDYVGEALLWTLSQSLGRDFTSEHYLAWEEAYGILSSVMIDAARLQRAN